jgi:hypothetical protein
MDGLDADELALIWRQAEELRDETVADFVALHDSRLCPNRECGSALAPVGTRDGDLVCGVCGWVCDSAVPAVGFDDTQRAHRAYYGYNAVFHLNERVANLNCTDPRLPDDLFALVKEVHARYGFPTDGTLWHGNIGQILGLVEVPFRLQEKYRGKRYTCAPLTDMKKKFHERWITLRYRLTGERPPVLPYSLIKGMRDRLVAFLVPWRRLRHAPDCDGGVRCHKRFPCRFKLPDNAFLMWLFMCDIVGEDGAEPYVPYLFYQGQKPLSSCNDYMLKLIATAFRWNGTRAIYDDGDPKWILPHYRDRPWAQ